MRWGPIGAVAAVAAAFVVAGPAPGAAACSVPDIDDNGVEIIGSVVDVSETSTTSDNGFERTETAYTIEVEQARGFDDPMIVVIVERPALCPILDMVPGERYRMLPFVRPLDGAWGVDDHSDIRVATADEILGSTTTTTSTAQVVANQLHERGRRPTSTFANEQADDEDAPDDESLRLAGQADEDEDNEGLLKIGLGGGLFALSVWVIRARAHDRRPRSFGTAQQLTTAWCCAVAGPALVLAGFVDLM